MVLLNETLKVARIVKNVHFQSQCDWRAANGTYCRSRYKRGVVRQT